MALFCCAIPQGSRRDEFDPFPGDDDAMLMGCTCPAQKLWPASLVFASDCPVHVLEAVTETEH